MTLESFISSFGYVGVFLLVFMINVVPAFMPPTWLFLSTVYLLFPHYFHPALLSLTGTFASTSGRIILSYIGAASRRVMKEERRRSMDWVGRSLRSRRYGGFLLSFIFALGPLPSNIYFLAVGMMKCQYFSVFFGFWLGRLISYWVMINVMRVTFRSLMDALTSQIGAVVLIDSLGILSMVVFAFIDWEKLIRERRLVLIKPKILG